MQRYKAMIDACLFPILVYTMIPNSSCLSKLFSRHTLPKVPHVVPSIISKLMTSPSRLSLPHYSLTALGVTNTPSPLAQTTNLPSSPPSFCKTLACNLTPLPLLSTTSTSTNTIPGVCIGAVYSIFSVFVNVGIEGEECSNSIPMLSSSRTAVMPPWRMWGWPFSAVPMLKRMFILSRGAEGVVGEVVGDVEAEEGRG